MRAAIPAALAGERVDRAVAMLTGLARAEVAALVESGDVKLAGRPVRTRSKRVAEGDVLEVEVPDRPDERVVADPSVHVPIAFADEDVIVVDKPADLVVHPGNGHETGTLVHGLLAQFPDMADVGEPDRPGIVHRLDKGTSGLLVVARSREAYESLVEQLSRRTVTRAYVALVWGGVSADAGLIDAPLARSEQDPTRIAVSHTGREARTRYTVIDRFTEPTAATQLECRLETGRTHQIRVHLQAIGHPVVGDDRYGGLRRGVQVERPFLHAVHLAFVHPASGETMAFDSPLPADLAAVLDQFT